MSNTDEKNIVVNRGIPPGNPYGSGGGLPASRDGWTIGFGSGGGRGESGRAGALSGSRRRRLRIQDKRRRKWEAYLRAEAAKAKAAADVQEKADAQSRAQEQAIADAKAYAHAQAQVEAQRKADAQARAEEAAAEANTRAERERAAAAYRQALDSLPLSHAAQKQQLEQKHAQDVSGLPASLKSAFLYESTSHDLEGQQLLDAILADKARLNYLIVEKTEISNSKRQHAHAFAGCDPGQITREQFRAILETRSVNSEQAHEVYQAWGNAYSAALDADLYSRAVTELLEKSASLSERYAELAWKAREAAVSNERLVLKHAGEVSRLWSVVTGPNTPAQDFPSAKDTAKAVAEKLFTRQAARVLGRALPHLALLYPAELANAELEPSIIASPASGIGFFDVDLDFIANRGGTIEVTHRLRIEESEGDLRAVWREADGVAVGSKVRVRPFIYNSSTQVYEFKRDGAAGPSLIWTPALSPESSTTVLPVDAASNAKYPGATISPVSEALGRFPTYDLEDFEDYIVVFPADAGLPPVYIMFNSPRYLPGVVSGMGEAIDPGWQQSASDGLGSPVPSVIADALRGRNYAEFRNLKRAIWREMSKHPKITANMSDRNIALIKAGLAPFAARQDRKVEE